MGTCGTPLHGVALSGSLVHPTTNDVTITICLIGGRSEMGESLGCLLFESTRVGFMIANYEIKTTS
jgi:hypothetical protein